MVASSNKSHRHQRRTVALQGHGHGPNGNMAVTSPWPQVARLATHSRLFLSRLTSPVPSFFITSNYFAFLLLASVHYTLANCSGSLYKLHGWRACRCHSPRWWHSNRLVCGCHLLLTLLVVPTGGPLSPVCLYHALEGWASLSVAGSGWATGYVVFFLIVLVVVDLLLCI